jgi:hypothetical protein
VQFGVQETTTSLVAIKIGGSAEQVKLVSIETKVPCLHLVLGRRVFQGVRQGRHDSL